MITIIVKLSSGGWFETLVPEEWTTSEVFEYLYYNFSTDFEAIGDHVIDFTVKE